MVSFLRDLANYQEMISRWAPLLCVGFVASVCGASSFHIEEQDFRLINAKGQAQKLSYFTDQEFIVLIAWPQAGCPSEKIFSQWFKDVQKHLSPDRHVRFLALNSDPQQNRATVPVEVLMDSSQSISRSFGFKKSGDYVVLKTQPWGESFRGSWGSGKLEKFLALPPSLKFSRGCSLRYEGFAEARWSAGLARVFFRNCVSCHLKQESTDFFRSDDDIFKWQAMNRQVLRLYRMPNHGYDVDPANSNCTGALGFRLREKELAQIQKWLEVAGPHEKQTQDFTENLIKEARARFRSQHPDPGPPDLIWKMKEPFRIPASGSEIYQVSQIAGPLPEDIEIAAYDLEANANAIHHLQLYSSEKPIEEKAYASNEAEKSPMMSGGGGLRSLTYISFDKNAGAKPEFKISVLKNSYVALETHYKITGKEETNQAALKIYLRKKTQDLPALKSAILPVISGSVPAGAKNLEVTAEKIAQEDMSLVELTSHTHSRGVAFRLNVTDPEGQLVSICNIPYFQEQNLRLVSEFIEPVFVRKGSKISAIYTFDNSSQNLKNPDATKDVPLGLSLAKNEMAFTRLMFVPGPYKRSLRCWDEDLGCSPKISGGGTK